MGMASRRGWGFRDALAKIAGWAMALLLAPSVASAQLTLTYNTTAQELAEAMGAAESDIQSAVLSNTLVGKALATGRLGRYFRTEGNNFAILSTGRARKSAAPDRTGSRTTVLGGLNNEEGDDMVRLTLTLNRPSTAQCLAFDFVFYTEEFPEASSPTYMFNDTFTAEVGGTDLEIIENEVFAPLNFAFDEEGQPISAITADLQPDTLTTYDGGTRLMRAMTPVSGGTVEITFTIQDIGDSRYDSTVFLDNLHWLNEHCEAGAVVVPSENDDTDEDGLPDSWETDGVDVDEDGIIDLDLPAMGANPMRKDIFIEIDYMLQPGFSRFGVVFAGHSHQPTAAALARVIRAFRDAPVDNPDESTGITLHIDAGPDSVMDPVLGKQWKLLSQSDVLAHQDHLGAFGEGGYDWTAFEQIKAAKFSAARRVAFHYAVFGHFLGTSEMSGISKFEGSDFIVTLGAFNNPRGTTVQQAGTLMHELGHNLGLLDGGGDEDLFKPNYLSVMNPFFQTRGVRRGGDDGHIEFSFAELFELDEEDLFERDGLVDKPEPGEANPLAGYGTRFFCPTGNQRTDLILGNINWNCNGIFEEESVTVDVNGSGAYEILSGFDDWGNLVFNGGEIGPEDPEEPEPEPEPEDPDDDTEDEEEEPRPDTGGITRAQDALISTAFAVEVAGPSRLAQLAGTSQIYDFQITNVGQNADTFTLAATSILGWAQVGSLPASLAVEAGKSATVSIEVIVPAGTPANTSDTLTLTATSVESPLMEDSATTFPYVPENPPVAHAGPDQRLECSSQNGTPATLDGSGSQAPSGNTLEYQWTGPFPEGGGKVSGVRPTVTLPLGVSKITLRVNDEIVDSYPDEVVVTVVDTIPPVISAVLSPVVLWPPNHDLRDIAAVVQATDICTIPVVTLSSLSSSEPDDARGGGDGHTVNDIQGAAIGTTDFAFRLRSERSGSGPGRTYTVQYTATDSSGNQAHDVDTVKVPHSQKK
jgi:hypothetical protein